MGGMDMSIGETFWCCAVLLVITFPVGLLAFL